MLETAQYMDTVADKHEDKNIIGVERYKVKLKMNGRSKDVIIFIKHAIDKRRYYDHGYMKSDT